MAPQDTFNVYWCTECMHCTYVYVHQIVCRMFACNLYLFCVQSTQSLVYNMHCTLPHVSLKPKTFKALYSSALSSKNVVCGFLSPFLLHVTNRLVCERTIEENILKKANQKRMLGDIAIEGGAFTTDFFKQVCIPVESRARLKYCPRGRVTLYARHTFSQRIASLE